MKYLLTIVLLTSSLTAMALEPWDASACRGAIALDMYKDVSIIKVDSRSGNTFKLSYIRPSDGKQWRYACKVVGASPVWASIMDNGSQGRWRNGQYDTSFTATSKSPDAKTVKVCNLSAKECVNVSR